MWGTLAAGALGGAAFSTPPQTMTTLATIRAAIKPSTILLRIIVLLIPRWLAFQYAFNVVVVGVASVKASRNSFHALKYDDHDGGVRDIETGETTWKKT
jgi:hypothetical protein